MALALLAPLLVFGCVQSDRHTESALPKPDEIVDLGALVTEDLPERVWGKGFMTQMGFTESNTFDVISWDFGLISGSNAYYMIFNHGGPHVDAPNHMGLGSGLDSYAIESFIGPARVIDMSHLPAGRSVTKEMLEDQDIEPGDIVLMYTDYVPPQTESALPESITLNFEASEYLASIPIHAFGTDAFARKCFALQRLSLLFRDTGHLKQSNNYLWTDDSGVDSVDGLRFPVGCQGLICHVDRFPARAPLDGRRYYFAI